MSQLQVRFEENRSAYRPGAELRGTASWQLDTPARRIELRLCWLAQGIGIPEARVVEVISIDRPDIDSRRSFTFRLPEAPLSYLGAMSSLFWAVELVILPSQESAHAVFCLSPTGTPIPLAPSPEQDTEEDEDATAAPSLDDDE